MRVLIAEDEAVTQRLLEAYVRRLGHEASVVGSGTEAWSLLEAYYLPLVITDWIMPGMNGLELCGKIRQRGGERYTYVILLTAVEGRERFFEAMESGVDDFLTKPPDFDQLGARIRVAERILGLEHRLKRLEGLLPICSYCRRIRDAQDTWTPIEQFLSETTESLLSHGICPDCYQRHVQPQLDALK